MTLLLTKIIKVAIGAALVALFIFGVTLKAAHSNTEQASKESAPTASAILAKCEHEAEEAVRGKTYMVRSQFDANFQANMEIQMRKGYCLKAVRCAHWDWPSTTLTDPGGTFAVTKEECDNEARTNRRQAALEAFEERKVTKNPKTEDARDGKVLDTYRKTNSALIRFSQDAQGSIRVVTSTKNLAAAQRECGKMLKEWATLKAASVEMENVCKDGYKDQFEGCDEYRESIPPVYKSAKVFEDACAALPPPPPPAPNTEVAKCIKDPPLHGQGDYTDSRNARGLCLCLFEKTGNYVRTNRELKKHYDTDSVGNYKNENAYDDCSNRYPN